MKMHLHEQNKSEIVRFRKKSVPMPTCSNSCEIQLDVGLLPRVVFTDIKNYFAMKQVLCLEATESIQLQLSGKSQLSDKQLGAATMRQSACRQHGCYWKGKQASPVYLEPCFLRSKLGEQCGLRNHSERLSGRKPSCLWLFSNGVLVDFNEREMLCMCLVDNSLVFSIR